MGDFDEKFNDDFIKNIANDPLQSILNILDSFFDNMDSESLEIEDGENYSILVKGTSLINWICDNHKTEGFRCDCHVAGSKNLLKYHDLRKCLQGVHSITKKLKILENGVQAYNRYDTLLSDKFTYKFSEEDVDRIQTLINELRKELEASDLFKDEHKKRLLARLEKLQAEIHKEMSDIDKIWGLVGDAGIVLGKFGKDAKPFVDRIKEITKIGWKKQSEAEGLPENTQNPLLGIN